MTKQLCPRRAENPISLQLSAEDTWREDNTCSYCGSLNPDEFIRLLECGEIELGPTDKSYKVYLHGADGKRSRGKFYFQHLSQAQKDRFIEIYNEGKMKIGFPGHFYTTPYFCSVVKREEAK